MIIAHFRVYVHGHKKIFWALLRAHFNPRLTTRAKMSLSRAQNIFMSSNINSIVLLQRTAVNAPRYYAHRSLLSSKFEKCFFVWHGEKWPGYDSVTVMEVPPEIQESFMYFIHMVYVYWTEIWWKSMADQRKSASSDNNIRELKHARFWDADGNRKRTFHMPGQWCLPDVCTNHL